MYVYNSSGLSSEFNLCDFCAFMVVAVVESFLMTWRTPATHARLPFNTRYSPLYCTL